MRNSPNRSQPLSSCMQKQLHVMQSLGRIMQQWLPSAPFAEGILGCSISGLYSIAGRPGRTQFAAGGLCLTIAAPACGTANVEVRHNRLNNTKAKPHTSSSPRRASAPPGADESHATQPPKCKGRLLHVRHHTACNAGLCNSSWGPGATTPARQKQCLI